MSSQCAGAPGSQFKAAAPRATADVQHSRLTANCILQLAAVLHTQGGTAGCKGRSLHSHHMPAGKRVSGECARANRHTWSMEGKAGCVSLFCHWQAANIYAWELSGTGVLRM